MTAQFDVIQEQDLLNFRKQVQKKLHDGWMLHGNFIALPNPSYKAAYKTALKEHPFFFFQAVTKEGKGEVHNMDKDSGSDPFDEF